MAKIESQSIWKDGKSYEADDLSVIIVSDNLSDNASFYYKISVAPVETKDAEGVVISHVPGTTLADGNVTISGEDYDAWGDAANVNLAAYEYVASKLGLTLV